MNDRIIEIASDNKHLSHFRGFMLVEEKGEEIARIPLDDIGAVIACAHGLSYSNSLLVEMAKRGALMVYCSPNFAPIGFLWPLEGNHIQSARIQAQIENTKPKAKKLWKSIIRQKIIMQSDVLQATHSPHAEGLKSMASRVQAGDQGNLEAQAARRYWTALMGDDFRRDRHADDVNSLLNYGYTIIRSCVARYILAAGLHPAMGIFHHNNYNSMRLVDDLMEPYRPYVDYLAYSLKKNDQTKLSKEIKLELATLLEHDVPVYDESDCLCMVPLKRAIQKTTTSLALFYEGKTSKLVFPQPSFSNLL